MEGVTKKRCAIYTRKSVEDGLEQEFNSLDAQREAGESYVTSQKANGWICLPERYDDGGFSGGNIERPALKKLLKDCENGLIDIIVVYKIDRLSRSILDFAELTKLFDKWDVAFVSVTQEINTHTSAGRMMLNILITFAQFEREVITERIRDKMSASRKKGKWVGGNVPYGYKVENKKLIPATNEAVMIRHIFKRYLEIQSCKQIALELHAEGYRTRRGQKWRTDNIRHMLNNYTYIGKVFYKGAVFDGEQEAIISESIWERVHAILAQNDAPPDRARRVETIAALKNVLYCGHCHTPMIPTFTKRHGKHYLYYRCLKSTHHAFSNCPIGQISAGEIESHIFEQLTLILMTPEVLAGVARESGTQLKQVANFLKGELWKTLTQLEKQRLVDLLINKIDIFEDHLSFEIKANGAETIMEELSDENNCKNA